MKTPGPKSLSALPLSVLLTGFLTCAPHLFSADEICMSCGGHVSVAGTFAHHKDAPAPASAEAPKLPEAFLEDVNGTDFVVTISNLPAGSYVLNLRAAETEATHPGERIFSVTCGETVLAKDLDLFVTAGGARKVASISGLVEKPDDALRGPLRLHFVASKGRAKFNSLEVLNVAGNTVASVRASELAEAFSASAIQVPVVSEPPIWRDEAKGEQARVEDLVRRMSLAEKVSQLKNAAPGIPRLGLPSYDYWNEALHGVANNGDATVFPQSVGAASSWNPALFRAEGRIIGIEGRAKFNDYATKHNGDSKWWSGLTFWTPNINIFRDPRWGRGQETFGEDPYLTAEIGVEFVKGIQGDDPKYMLAMACAKHFAVHSGPELDRHRFDAQVSERDLYETYLPQFERVVREGKVGGVMSAYNSVNGTPATGSAFLLDELLRKQWGFDGYVVSDCDAVHDIYGEKQHHFVKTAEEAAALAVKAGCNLCCGGDYDALVRAVQQGLLTEKQVDQALYRTLSTRLRLGLLNEKEKIPFSNYTLKDNDTPEHAQVALQLARQSLVLLKNDGILPLAPNNYKKIAVIGPNADSKSMLDGNYHGSASHPVSILSGIRQIAGPKTSVAYAMGSPITTKTEIAPWSAQDNTTKRSVAELKAEALALAADSDLIIFVGGITAAQEGESFDRENIELPAEQQALIRELQATGKKLVLVNCSGSAMALPWEAEHLPAILQAWYPGQLGGQAVAEVLFGEVTPSGHLPITFYRATADLPSFTDYSMKNRTYRFFGGKPLFAFGHGLSYTNFEFKRAQLDSRKIPATGTAKVRFTITNTGARDGATVAQLYFRHVNSKVPQPLLSLCGFSRVELGKGTSGEIAIEVPTERLRYWDDVNKHYVVEPGDYEFLIGAASDDIRLRLPFTITAK